MHVCIKYKCLCGLVFFQMGAPLHFDRILIDIELGRMFLKNPIFSIMSVISLFVHKTDIYLGKQTITFQLQCKLTIALTGAFKVL